MMVQVRSVILMVLTIAGSAGAATLRMRNGQILDGDVRFEPPGWVQVLPRTPGDFPLAFKLSDVLSLSLRPPLAGIRSGGMLPGEWAVLDVGASQAGGSTDYALGEFTLRGEGAAPSAVDTLHYCYHRLPCDGQIIARVRSLAGHDSDLDPLAAAGLMIRTGIEPGERFCSISITPNDGARFDVRRAVDAPLISTPVVGRVKIKAPYWLKLMRYGDQIVVHISYDGRTWELIANPRFVNLQSCYIGLFVNSARAGRLAAAVFDHVRVTIHGIEGQYFGDTTFKDLRLTRIDPGINFLFGGLPPDEKMPGQNYSVRWTGQLLAPSSDTYRFALAADAAARLYINDKIILDTASKAPHDGTVKLLGEKRYDIRVDYLATTTPATACRLYWSTSLEPNPTIIPTEYLFYTPTLKEEPAPDPTAAPPKPWATAKGILLADGSYLPGTPSSADDKSVTFARPGQKPMNVPIGQVAWLVLHPLTDVTKTPGKTPGLLTLAGDFLEGDCQEITDGKAKLNSVVFGESSFDITTQTAAIVFRGPHPSTAPWVIRTTSGGVILATSFTATPQTVTLQQSSLGSIDLRVDEIVDITRR